MAKWCRTHPVSPPSTWLPSKQKVPRCPAQSSALHFFETSVDTLRPLEVIVFFLSSSEHLKQSELHYSPQCFYSMKPRLQSYSMRVMCETFCSTQPARIMLENCARWREPNLGQLHPCCALGTIHGVISRSVSRLCHREGYQVQLRTGACQRRNNTSLSITGLSCCMVIFQFSSRVMLNESQRRL